MPPWATDVHAVGRRAVGAGGYRRSSRSRSGQWRLRAWLEALCSVSGARTTRSKRSRRASRITSRPWLAMPSSFERRASIGLVCSSVEHGLRLSSDTGAIASSGSVAVREVRLPRPPSARLVSGQNAQLLSKGTLRVRSRCGLGGGVAKRSPSPPSLCMSRMPRVSPSRSSFFSRPWRSACRRSPVRVTNAGRRRAAARRHRARLSPAPLPMHFVRSGADGVVEELHGVKVAVLPLAGGRGLAAGERRVAGGGSEVAKRPTQFPVGRPSPKRRARW